MIRSQTNDLQIVIPSESLHHRVTSHEMLTPILRAKAATAFSAS